MKGHLSKKDRKVKAKNKFTLISKILPEIAKKSSEMLGKPTPPIDDVITKIMNIIWIDDDVQYEDGKIKSTISITNYKNKPQSFELYAALPDERELGEIKPEAQKVEEEYIMWKIEKIKPAEKIELSFQLMGMEKGDFEENILYVRGIDPVNVIGAEKWEGD